MNSYQIINYNNEIFNKDKSLLYCILHYYSFIKKFDVKVKSNQIESESVYLINKKWMVQFLHFFNKIKIVIQYNESYAQKRNELTFDEEKKLINEINKYQNMQEFIKNVENMHTLRKIYVIEKQEYFEEYALIDGMTNYYFHQVFQKDKYTDTTAQLIIIDRNNYILEYNDHFRIEVVTQNDNFTFLNRYLVIFKSNFNIYTFELILLKEGLQGIQKKYKIDFSKKINHFYVDYEEIKMIDLLSIENESKTDCFNNNENSKSKYSEEIIQNKLVHCIISLFVFEDSLKINYKKNSIIDSNYFDIHLIDKHWLDKFKEKYNYSNINSVLYLSNSSFILSQDFIYFKELINKNYPMENEQSKLLEPIKEPQEYYYINENNDLELQYYDNYSFLDIETFNIFKDLFGIQEKENKNLNVKLNIYKDNIFIIDYNRTTMEILKLGNNDNLIQRYFIKGINESYNLIIKSSISSKGLEIALKEYKIADNSNKIKQDIVLTSASYNINYQLQTYSNIIGSIYNINLIKKQNILKQKPDNKTNPHPKELSLTRPCFIGLDNIGATGYMNASLQSLSNIPQLTKYLLKRQSKIHRLQNEYKLTNAYLEILKHLWTQNNNFTKSYAPYNFKKLISKMNPLFDGIQANDAKDLIYFILSTMHNELNTIKSENNFKQENSLDKYDYNKTLNNFVLYFKENYKSIISDLFYGLECGALKCCNCNSITYYVQCINLLIFPLEKVREFFGYNQGDYVTITQCFQYYEKKILFNGASQIFCQSCNQMSDCYNDTKLVTGPNILILILNRGKGLEFDVKIKFEFTLNISKFVLSNISPINYELINIVTHLGESSMSGHFVAYCKSFVDENWYLFNDSMISKIDNIKDLYNGTAYILFYKAMDINK